MGTGNIVRTVGLVIIIVALAGCTGSGALPSAPAASPATVDPAAAATMSSAPDPSASAATTSASAPTGRILVSGTADCPTGGDMTETTEGQVTTYRGAITCTVSMSDPRVSGDLRGELTIAYVELPGYKIDKWTDSITITNAGGTWRGTGFGSEFWDEAGGLRTTGTEFYVGEGGYAGLTLRTLLAQSPDWDQYIIAGWIEPAR